MNVSSAYMRPLVEGQRISLADFILLCARQSQQLAFMRDLPLVPSIRIPDEIPVDPPLDYTIQDYEEQIRDLKKRSLNYWAHAANDDYQSKVAEAVRQNNENAAIRNRLTKMQARVITFFIELTPMNAASIRPRYISWQGLSSNSLKKSIEPDRSAFGFPKNSHLINFVIR